MVAFFFFFKQKTAYELRISDWSSDVCSSDLRDAGLVVGPFDLGACIEALPVRLDAAEDAQRRDARPIGAAVDLRARHIGGDVGADLEAADLRPRRCALELEAPDARLVLPEQVKRHFVLDRTSVVSGKSVLSSDRPGG